jgi:hypothetical protein
VPVSSLLSKLSLPALQTINHGVRFGTMNIGTVVVAVAHAYYVESGGA